ncbi:MAG: beta-1,6-N-acetylglucosaminyltransferase [Chitinophagaceae bacterium]
MRIAHLILTHKNPGQLNMLVKVLDHPSCTCFIHIDNKTPIEPFLFIGKQERVYFIRKRIPVYWAGYGTIQATINGFQEILPLGYDYVNVISGQDFPLKNAEEIYSYIKNRKGTEFITCQSIEGEWKQAAARVRKYHLINWRIPGRFRLEKVINWLLPTRKFPFDHKIVGRANWFTLSKEAILFCLDFLNQHPELVRYYKLCWGADEFIFSTILYNSHFNEKIVDNLVYVDWTGRADGHPRILGMEDLPKLKTTEKLFARKFDEKVDNNILTELDALLRIPKNAAKIL